MHNSSSLELAAEHTNLPVSRNNARADGQLRILGLVPRGRNRHGKCFSSVSVFKLSSHNCSMTTILSLNSYRADQHRKNLSNSRRLQTFGGSREMLIGLLNLQVMQGHIFHSTDAHAKHI